MLELGPPNPGYISTVQDHYFRTPHAHAECYNDDRKNMDKFWLAMIDADWAIQFPIQFRPHVRRAHSPVIAFICEFGFSPWIRSHKMVLLSFEPQFMRNTMKLHLSGGN